MLNEINCREEVPRPENTPVLHSKFVLKRERNESGEIKKYKARLVVFGNEEVKNDEESFSPVPDFTIIKLILFIAAQRDWHCTHFDFQSAFSNRRLTRPVYMDLRRHVCKSLEDRISS